ncbi:methylated-DNA--[protein]-cysteine S-methyltransferase [Apilactobacillus kunkeei]|uniref:MGMT family protein n=1 Tax=Apilactobacillus kunkeei TaxID=148814 RepID=UPI00110CADF3|nr:MGMT family protein [Apilactobacillus kunkeei]TMT00096.1 methylated-DNA--[protein]-cysteine S-methyltransferase [Apilactobacillus kunkeei]
MEKLYWNQVEYQKQKIYFTCTREGIHFVNNPNTGISNIYNFYSKLDAEFIFNRKVTEEYKIQLREYIDGTRKYFEIPIDLSTSRLNEQIYQKINDIDYGDTMDIKEFCDIFDFKESDIRKAVITNPLILIIPSHRILNVDYSDSYRKLADFNNFLLDLERE